MMADAEQLDIKQSSSTSMQSSSTSSNGLAIAMQLNAGDDGFRGYEPKEYLCLLLLPMVILLILRRQKQEIVRLGSLLINVSLAN